MLSAQVLAPYFAQGFLFNTSVTWTPLPHSKDVLGREGGRGGEGRLCNGNCGSDVSALQNKEKRDLSQSKVSSAKWWLAISQTFLSNCTLVKVENLTLFTLICFIVVKRKKAFNMKWPSSIKQLWWIIRDNSLEKIIRSLKISEFYDRSTVPLQPQQLAINPYVQLVDVHCGVIGSSSIESWCTDHP